MYFLIEDDGLLEKYNTVWDKKFLKTKVKSHVDEVTDFQDKKNLKVDSNQSCLAVISLDSVLKKDVKYYPQMF